MRQPQLQVRLDTRVSPKQKRLLHLHAVHYQSQPHMQSALVTGECEGMQVGKIPRAAGPKQNVPRSMNSGRHLP